MSPATITRQLPRLCTALAALNVAAVVVAIGARAVLDWAPYAAFKVYFFSARTGLYLAALGLVILIVVLIMKQRGQWKHGLAVFLLGIAPLGTGILVVGPDRFFGSPMIHDISTDLIEPPEFVAAGSLRKPGENTLEYGGAEVADKQRAAYPDIEPLESPLGPDRAFDRAMKVVGEMGWMLIANDRSEGRIEAYDRTALFGFVDDVVIRISPAPGGSRIDVRSVSRVGLGDVGANALRIRRFLEAFRSAET